MNIIIGFTDNRHQYKLYYSRRRFKVKSTRLAVAPLEVSRGVFNIVLKEKYKIIKGAIILRAISLGRVAVPSPKIIIKLPRTYEKLHCKGEPYRFSG